MTRKDYVAMAEAIRKMNGTHYTGNIEPWQYRAVKADMVDVIADTFKADNGRFDRDRFVRACGFDPAE